MNPTTSTGAGNATLDTFIAAVEKQVINPLVILITIVAFVIFIWGVINYIRYASNDEKRGEAQQGMLYGIAGLVIIFGAIAIVNILKNVAGWFNTFH